MDADPWPEQAVSYRAEAGVAAGPPGAVPGPFLGWFDDGRLGTVQTSWLGRSGNVGYLVGLRPEEREEA